MLRPSRRQDAGVGVDVRLLQEAGVLLESARGPIPNVAELVAGEPIKGSWWGHPAGHEIFRVINVLADSPDVARMRLVNGKITLVHRRLWPALIRLASRFDEDAVLVIREQHTPTGAHRTTKVPLRDWVPADVRVLADNLTEAEAVASLPPCLQ